MKAINYSKFRNNLVDNLNAVNDDRDILIVSRSKGRNFVIMSLEEYNSTIETLYLNSSHANCKRLEKSIENFKKGILIKKDLIES